MMWFARAVTVVAMLTCTAASAAELTLRGLVQDERSAEPIPAAVVTIRTATDSTLVYRSSTDGLGTFAFNAGEPGDYSIEVTKLGFVNANAQSYTLSVSTLSSTIVNPVVFRLARASTISGTVRSAEKIPRSIVVALFTTAGSSRLLIAAQSEIDERGRYKLDGVAAGAYLVALIPAPYSQDQLRTVVPTYYPNEYDWSRARPVIVGAGEEHDGIDITLPQGPSVQVRGTVRDPQSTPKRAMVLLYSPRLNIPFASAVADIAGSFELSGVPIGSYEIVAVSEVIGLGSSELILEHARSGRQSLVVTGNMSGVELLLLPSVNLLANVVLDRASPECLKAITSLDPIDPAPLSVPKVRADAQGRWTTKILSQSRYLVSVQSSPYNCFLKGLTVSEGGNAKSEVSCSQDCRLTLVLTSRVGSIHGWIPPSSRIAQGCQAVLISTPDQAPPRIARLASCESNNNFVFEDLAPGDYGLAVLSSSDSSCLANSEDVSRIAATSTKLSVASGEATQVEIRSYTNASSACPGTR